MDIIKTWVAPAHNTNDMCSISIRVSKNKDKLYPLILDKHTTFAECIIRKEVHYNFGMFTIEAIVKLRDAINEYIIKYNNGKL